MAISRRYCGIKELNLYTSIPLKTLYDWSERGKIPAIKINGRLLFDLDEIDKWFAEQKGSSRAIKTINKIIDEAQGKGYDPDESCQQAQVKPQKGGK